mmetsp:Transcript_53565/g.96114  ORF Transcript_53565/g.96114 Transcript_53565/m.96114 type:complete len:486 (+) Transcript_53565:91-1548(+)|eukprot:CAMPEP_0197623872 /NCGR_PEP_ID=MMETSP1338-20131121/3765_1 /TAXON_ID=43686 ORGANISM="Pelagodinium beii, Strain RCC1491" /NCGR_SAMPLE_ID=MMETSP1338 /ASSEMBLY_ACC=CAM_ASM_000754 /LENGTH=485 /DNA_ID=CAMNT_0043193959 /DNA_START=75 /DNA_END=1532 /DNA_ORIENTATION=+
MSKYGTLSRSDGHSKWFLQKTLTEHDRSMDNPWMQMIYNQCFSIKQYASWLAINHAIFQALERSLDPSLEPLSRVHDPELHRTKKLEVDLARLLGPTWNEEVQQICKASEATRRYVELLEKDAADPWLLLAHHFLQYNAVLAGGSYLGEMVSQKLCVPHGAPGVQFYDFAGVQHGKQPARVQRYLRDFDKIQIEDGVRHDMLATMTRIYEDTEAMMAEVFALNPADGIDYKKAKDKTTDAPSATPPPCAEQLTLSLSQLQAYTGTGEARILLSLAGELLDVSAGREMYGPGGGYAILAGHDVTRCLATMSLEAGDLDDLRWTPDCAEDEEALNNWRSRLKEKYPVAGKLTADKTPTTTTEGLRKRTPEASAKPSVAGEKAGTSEKCPISGKEGTCPMAAILGGGKTPAKAPSAPATGSKPQGTFMAGKSLVASVEKKSSSEESLLYRLCPLHWDDKTIKMVVMIAVTSWMSGIFVGWNLRRALLS